MGLFSKLFESSNSKSFDNMLTLHSSITRALAGVAYFDSTIGSIARAIKDERAISQIDSITAALIQALIKNGTATENDTFSSLIGTKLQRLHECNLKAKDLNPCVFYFLLLALSDANELHVDKTVSELLAFALSTFWELADGNNSTEMSARRIEENSSKFKTVARYMDIGEVGVFDLGLVRSITSSPPNNARLFDPFEEELHKAGFDRFLSGQNRIELENCLREECLDIWYGLYGQKAQTSLMENRDIAEAILQNDMSTLSTALKATKESNPEIFNLSVQIMKNHFLVKGIVDKNEDLIEIALTTGANPNRKCRYQGVSHTPIVAAARTGDTDICKRLIEAGADVNKAQSNSETALANAALLGDVAMVQLLLSKGADPNAMTHAGTALTQASNTAVLFALLSGGADPNIGDKDEDLPIITFISENRYEAVFALTICGTNLQHKNENGLTAIDYARKYSNEKMVRILTERDYRSQLPSVNLESMRNTLENRIKNLPTFSYPLNYYPTCKIEKYRSLITESQRERERQAGNLVQKAISAKRRGDLKEANQLYIDAATDEDVLVVDYIWGWFKVLLLAKNFEEAQLILRYYHALAVSKNFMLRYERELDFEETSIQECFLTMSFDAYSVFQEATDTWPLRKEDVEKKISLFGGSDYWNSYSLTAEEYDSFIRYFGYPELYGSTDWTNRLADDKINELENAILSGDPSAYPKLARLLYETDKERAIVICEKGIDAGDTNDAPFLIAWLTSKDDPERAKELYRFCIDNGHCYAAANNLGTLVEDDDPERAKELYQRAIEDGNRLIAARNLANLVRETDPERAKGLYRMAIDAGDKFASTFQLAILVEKTDKEQAEKLYAESVEAGDHHSASMRLAMLVEDDDPERAKEFYRMAIDAGNIRAYSRLARLVYKDDRERAIELCEKAVAAGDTDDGAFFLAWLHEKDSPAKARGFYQICINNKNCLYNAANNLGLLVQADDPERAKKLFQMSIDAGNSYYAANNLAQLIQAENPQKAEELYRMAIDAGNRLAAARNLASLVKESSPEKAMIFYQAAIDAGDKFTSTYQLATLIEKDDKERALSLYAESADAGNADAFAKLVRLAYRFTRESVASLCESAIEIDNLRSGVFNFALEIADSDPKTAEKLYQLCIDNKRYLDAAPNNLGVLVQRDDSERAKKLFRMAIDAGDSYYATNNLGKLIEKEDPEKALALFDSSAKAGNTTAFLNYSLLAEQVYPDSGKAEIEAVFDKCPKKNRNDYGVFYMTRDNDKAISIFENCIEAGDRTFAPCNLAHMLAEADPERAESLYRLSLENESHNSATEALIGLDLMLEQTSPKEAEQFLSTARERSNLQESIDFMTDYYDSIGSPLSERIRKAFDQTQPE